ncbi:MAG: hypothetical protein HY535_05725 [Chloroflexi bacterium]|nr:hypothetical protein [Chloroflexota bacterium]
MNPKRKVILYYALPQVLSVADLLVTYGSTTALEAMLQTKPVLILILTRKRDLVPSVAQGTATGVY